MSEPMRPIRWVHRPPKSEAGARRAVQHVVRAHQRHPDWRIEGICALGVLHMPSPGRTAMRSRLKITLQPAPGIKPCPSCEAILARWEKRWAARA